MEALLQLPKSVGQITVYRGVTGDLLTTTNDRGGYVFVEGELWVSWAFMSTTSKMSVIKNFLGDADPRTILIINTKHAVDIGVFSAIPGEHEMLIPAGYVFRVVSVMRQDGLSIVQLEDAQVEPLIVCNGPKVCTLSLSLNLTIDALLAACLIIWKLNEFTTYSL